MSSTSSTSRSFWTVWTKFDGLYIRELYAPSYGVSTLELYPVGVVSTFLAGVSCSYLPPGGLLSIRLFRLPDNGRALQGEWTQLI